MARRRHPEVKILFLADPELERYGAGLGAVLLGGKPSMPELVAEVARLSAAGTGC